MMPALKTKKAETKGAKTASKKGGLLSLFTYNKVSKLLTPKLPKGERYGSNGMTVMKGNKAAFECANGTCSQLAHLLDKVYYDHRPATLADVAEAIGWMIDALEQLQEEHGEDATLESLKWVEWS